MKQNIILYKDESLKIAGEENVDSYFEYMLMGNFFDVIRVGEPDLLKKAVREKETKLVLFYLDDSENMLSLLSCVRSITDKPIIGLYEGDSEQMGLCAFHKGVDDFCGKDCSILELIARIKTQIRSFDRLTQNRFEEHKLTLKGLELDDSAKQVTVEGKAVNLTPIEYKILYLLMEKQGHVLSNKQIYETIWKMEPIGADNTIAVHIRHLREKIEKNPKQPKWVQVVWGQGYKVG